jgi:DNA-directed RNA polymerase alpha subunit
METAAFPGVLERELHLQPEFRSREPPEVTVVLLEQVADTPKNITAAFLTKSLLDVVPLGMSASLAVRLIKRGIPTIEVLIAYSEQELREVPGVGKSKVWNIKHILQSRGLGLR